MSRPATDYTRLACGRTRRAFVACFVRSPSGTWELTEATVSGEASAFRDERPSSTVTGPFATSPEYRGCPDCGADGFVKCGQCGRLSCWSTATPEFACGWCANRGLVSGTIETLQRLE